MSILSLSEINRRKLITNISFFIVYAIILVLVTPDFNSYYNIGIRQTTYMYITCVALFFIHTLVLIPIVVEEKRYTKYLIYTTICIIIFLVVEYMFFKAIISIQVYPENNVFGINPAKIFQLKYLVRTAAASFIPLALIAILSFFYSVIIYGIKKIFPYLEFLVHAILLLILFAYMINFQRTHKFYIVSTVISLILFYAHTFIVIPGFFKKRYRYIIELIAIVVIYFALHFIYLYTSGYLKFDPETGKRITSADLIMFTLTPFKTVALILTLFLSFIYGYVRIKIRDREKSLKLKIKSKESELSMLKSQVNPHFLFNTLNTLYATALNENAEITGKSIAKLARLIRYMQEDIKKDFIPLNNEIKYAKDYIEIQKLRCAVEPTIQTSFENTEDYYISPGLIIPFVENAFKYGIDPSKPSNLEISIICKEDSISFLCVNSYDGENNDFTSQGFGIGINNARQRLNIVYPKKHKLEITKTDNTFLVNLELITS